MPAPGQARLLVALGWIWPGSAVAEIDSSTTFRLDLTNANEAAKKAKWSDPDRITVRPEGLGWGHGNEQGSRDVWLQTEPMGIGLSWRPTSMASIKASVEGPGTSGMLYARYSADGKHWTTWQHLEADAAAANGPTRVFRGTLRVPYRDRAPYDKLRLEYARRADVSWSSDEEALVKEILKGEPKFFETCAPFIGYVQLLYETQLSAGQRMKSLHVDVNWWVGGKHQPAKDESARKGRNPRPGIVIPRFSVQ